MGLLQEREHGWHRPQQQQRLKWPSSAWDAWACLPSTLTIAVLLEALCQYFVVLCAALAVAEQVSVPSPSKALQERERRGMMRLSR